MHPMITALLADGPVLTDGAWGTQFQALGLEPGQHPDLWNLAHPERVREVASRYVRAGSRVIRVLQTSQIAEHAGVGEVHLRRLHQALGEVRMVRRQQQHLVRIAER